MEQTLKQIGNSVGIIIPKSLMKRMGIKKGSSVVIQELENNDSFTVYKKEAAKRSSITPEFVKIVEGVNKRYGQALKKLANQK